MRKLLLLLISLMIALPYGNVENCFAATSRTHYSRHRSSKHHRVRTRARHGKQTAGNRSRTAKKYGAVTKSGKIVRRSYKLNNGQPTRQNNLVKIQKIVTRRHGRKRVLYQKIYTAPLSQTYNGIDISHYQHTIRWKALRHKQPHLQFAYIKATEGERYKDGFYKINVERAKAQGIKVGSYHFFRPNVSARYQFENFKSQINIADQDLLPMIDIEDCGEYNHVLVQRRLHELIDLMTDYFGQKPLIYTMISFYNSYLSNIINEYPLMIGGYTRKPVTIDGKEYCIWQFTASGNVMGIDGDVDLDVFNKGYNLDSIKFHKELITGFDYNKKERAEERESAEKPSDLRLPAAKVSVHKTVVPKSKIAPRNYKKATPTHKKTSKRRHHRR